MPIQESPAIQHENSWTWKG